MLTATTEIQAAVYNARGFELVDEVDPDTDFDPNSAQTTQNEPRNGKISVIIPTIGRPALADTLKSINNQIEQPAEIIIIYDPDRKGAPWARNQGALKASGEFLFFCDDDINLKQNAFKNLLQGLLTNKQASYSYGDYSFTNHPTLGDSTHKAKPFDAEALKKRNYICTMSLIRASDFTYWDETIDTLEDYDLWRRMLSKGQTGVYVPGILFDTSYTEGITTEAARRHAKLK